MCQMCDEYEAELRRMGIEPDPTVRDDKHSSSEDPKRETEPSKQEPGA